MVKTKSIKRNHSTKTKQRQQCEVFSRIVGYLRPVQAWNPGKQAEFVDRKEYKV